LLSRLCSSIHFHSLLFFSPHAPSPLVPEMEKPHPGLAFGLWVRT
jgi:hypothetical protein